MTMNLKDIPDLDKYGLHIVNDGLYERLEQDGCTLTDPYEHITWSVGNNDDFVCFDYAFICDGKYVVLHATVNSETAHFIDRFAYEVVPFEEAIDTMLGIIDRAWEWCYVDDMKFNKQNSRRSTAKLLSQLQRDVLATSKEQWDSNLWIRETFINADKGYRYGDTQIYETDCETTGELFHRLKREYGNARMMYSENRETGKSVRVGWVFHSTARYDDTDEPYKREVWVSVFCRKKETSEFYSAWRVLHKAKEV
jgi:hypothetical protein